MFCKLLCKRNVAHFVNINKQVMRCYCETHYDVLKLRRDCSTKDVREAFLKLSKEYHPDKSDKDTHGKFVKISEAYNVLSKPLARRDYDLGLANPLRSQRTTITYADQPVWTDHSFWEYRDRKQDKHYEAKPYYGIKGINKISNFAIVVFCIVFTTIGVTIQIVAIRSSFTFQRDQLEKYSAELAQIHSNIRKQALENGDKKQLELLKQKLNYKAKES